MIIFDKAEKWLDKQINLIEKYMNKITINGESFDVSGKDIVVKRNTVIVNGKVIKDDLSGTVKIEFQGDLASLDCTNAVINGNVQGNVDGANVTVNGNVRGNVDGTSIKCCDVGGDVDGTSVSCGNIKGDIDTMTVRKK